MDSSTKKNIKDIVCCPVCEILPTLPVYGCQNGHVICSSCRSKVKFCAVCRSECFNVRMLVVEELLVTKILPCEYQGDGCSMPLMTGQEYSAHILVCPYRPIECNSKAGISHCQSQSVRHDAYMNHLTEFHGATVVRKKSCVISCDINGPFTPKTFQCFNETFILYSHRNQTCFWTWVALLDNNTSNHIRFYIKLRLRYQVRGQELKSLVSDVFTQSSVHDLPDDIFKSGRCLMFSTTTLPDTAPPCVWPQYELVDDEERVIWGYDIEIWEECAYRNIHNRMTTLIYESNVQTTQNTAASSTAVPRSSDTIPLGVSPNDRHMEDDDDDDDEENSEIENEEEAEDMDDSTSVSAVVNCEELTVRRQPEDNNVVANPEDNNERVVEGSQDESQIQPADSVSQQVIPDECTSDDIPIDLSDPAADDDGQPAIKRIKIENDDQHPSFPNETRTIPAPTAVEDSNNITTITTSSHENPDSKMDQADTTDVLMKLETGSSSSGAANTSNSSRSHDGISNLHCFLL